jgi:hypothetical protein
VNKQQYEKLKGHTLKYKNYRQDHEDTFHNTLLVALQKEALDNNTFIHASYKLCRGNVAREAMYQEVFDSHFVECFVNDKVASKPELWLDYKKAYEVVSTYIYNNYKGLQAKAFVLLYLEQENTEAVVKKLNSSRMTILNSAGKVKREVSGKKSLQPYLEILSLSRRYNLTQT